MNFLTELRNLLFFNCFDLIRFLFQSVIENLLGFSLLHIFLFNLDSDLSTQDRREVVDRLLSSWSE